MHEEALHLSMQSFKLILTDLTYEEVLHFINAKFL